MDSGSVPGYSPTDISPLLLSVILEAVPALLDQHHRYDLPQLSQYLKTYYPEIQESLHSIVILTATTAARQAAILHGVVEKNSTSPDPKKRDFAAEAASTLSFWALGLRPVHRSGSVYRGDSNPVSVDSEVPAETVERPIDMASLPVPITRDAEFEDLMTSTTRVLYAPSSTTEAGGLAVTFPTASSMTAGRSDTYANPVQSSYTVPMHQIVDVPESPLIIYAPSDMGLDLDHSPGNPAEADKGQNNNSCYILSQNIQQPPVNFSQPVIVQQGTVLGESTQQVGSKAQQAGGELPHSVVPFTVSQQPRGEAQIGLTAQQDKGDVSRALVPGPVSRRVSEELQVRSKMQQAGGELSRPLMSVLASGEPQGERQKQNQLLDRSKKTPEHRRDRNRGHSSYSRSRSPAPRREGDGRNKVSLSLEMSIAVTGHFVYCSVVTIMDGLYTLWCVGLGNDYGQGQ